MRKGSVNAVNGGFSVQPTPEYTAKQEREQRMQERKENSPNVPTNKAIFDYLQDIADRQSEIYDMLKK